MTDPVCAFSIDLSDEVSELHGEMSARGKIQVADFAEEFVAPLSYWGEGQYRSQWREAVDRLSRLGRDSALITSMRDPALANFIFWWVLYRDEGLVHVQNHVLLLEELNGKFDEANVYNSIPRRETLDEDGVRVSEWTVELEQMALWLKREGGDES